MSDWSGMKLTALEGGIEIGGTPERGFLIRVYGGWATYETVDQALDAVLTLRAGGWLSDTDCSILAMEHSEVEDLTERVEQISLFRVLQDPRFCSSCSPEEAERLLAEVTGEVMAELRDGGTLP